MASITGVLKNYQENNIIQYYGQQFDIRPFYKEPALLFCQVIMREWQMCCLRLQRQDVQYLLLIFQDAGKPLKKEFRTWVQGKRCR